MSPIKTLARESDFFASIFSKILFSLFKTLVLHLRMVFTKLKPLFLVSSKAESLFSKLFSKTFWKPCVLVLWLLTIVVFFDYCCLLHLIYIFFLSAPRGWLKPSQIYDSKARWVSFHDFPPCYIWFAWVLDVVSLVIILYLLGDFNYVWYILIWF